MKILACPSKDIATGNPYVELLYRHIEDGGHHVWPYSKKRLAFGRYDTVHFHWPQALFEGRNSFAIWIKGIALRLVLAIWRLRGGGVVWTVHNIVPHEHRNWPQINLFRWAFIKYVTHVIFLTERGRCEAYMQYPELKQKLAIVIPHGHYKGAFARLPDLIERDAKEFRFGFFGAIRAYKNVPRLVKAFRGISSVDIRLKIVGSVKDEAIRSSVLACVGDDKRINLDFKLVEHDEVPSVFEGMSLVVLPFTEILNSGSAILALSMNRPILVPRKGAMAELQSIVGTDWVMLYDGELSSEILESAQNWVLSAQRNTPPDLSSLNWDCIAGETINFMLKT